MLDRVGYFEQAADVLRQAFEATHAGEQSILLDEALRLHRLALAEETAKLAGQMGAPGSSTPA